MTSVLQPTRGSGVPGAGPGEDGAPAAPGQGPRGEGSAHGAAGRLLRRMARGRPSDPVWARPALIGLLAGTALLYLWALGASGWANAFYSAAVQAGTKSWKAFFFGSSDAANFITVDKPPASLWVMELSARAFGLSSWSILVPQALEGVAAVALLYATMRRWFRPGAALLAGALLALTPVDVLMFRFNNPDALLTLLLTGAAYATVRALERADGRWLALAGALVGTGFITKMLQAFLIIPVIGILYLVAAPTGPARRLRQLAGAGVALVVASGWWVLAVQLTPARDRPYIGGSQDNNVLNLIFGYNGVGRLSGTEAGSVGGAGAGGARWGPVGWDRLFLQDMGGQISWLIPAALVLLVAGLWITRRAPRTDRTRAALVLWGGWLVVTGLVLSYARGIIHPYYTVALAPAVAAVVAIGVGMLWSRRASPAARVVLAATVAGTAVWAEILLGRTPTWVPWLRMLVLVAGIVGALVLLVQPGRGRTRAALAATGAAVAVTAAAAGPAAYSLDTAATPHQGAIPSAGPEGEEAPGGFGAGGFGAGRPGGGGARFGGAGAGFGGGPGPGGAQGGSGRPGAGAAGSVPVPGGAGGGGFSGGGGFGGGGGGFGGGGGGFGGGAAGGLLNSSSPGPALVTRLSTGARGYTWVAAVVDSNAAAGYQLATGDPVMAIGGFNGTDPAPTLQQFQGDVRARRVHYFIATGGGPSTAGGTTGADDATLITSWVEAHFRSATVDGATLYDLRDPRS